MRTICRDAEHAFSHDEASRLAEYAKETHLRRLATKQQELAVQ